MPELAPWLAKPEGGNLPPAPWLSQSNAPAEPAKQEGGMWASAADFFKSIPGGIAHGVTDFGRLGQAGQQQALGITPGMEAEEGIAPHQQPGAGGAPLVKAAESFHQPQGMAGRFGSAIGQAAGNPMSYLGGMGAARTGASVLGGGVGGQVGAELTPGSAVGPVIGGALGGLAGGTKGVAKAAPAPERGAIRDAAEAAYDTIKNSPRKIPVEETSLIAEKIRGKLNEEGIYREAPDGIAIFKTIDRLGGATSADHVTPGELHSIAKTLQKISSSNPGNATGRAAGLARSELFDSLKQFPELAEAIEVGNANYRAFKTSERLGEAQEKGQFMARGTMTGDNIDPALRTQMRQLYFNKKVNKTPEEKEILRSIVEGDTASNIAKKFNLLRTPLRHLSTAVLHAKGAGVLSHAAHMLMKSISNRATTGKIERLDELVRSTAPAAGPRPPTPPPSNRGAQRAVQAARGGAIGAQRKEPQLYE